MKEKEDKDTSIEISTLEAKIKELTSRIVALENKVMWLQFKSRPHPHTVNPYETRIR